MLITSNNYDINTKPGTVIRGDRFTLTIQQLLAQCPSYSRGQKFAPMVRLTHKRCFISFGADTASIWDEANFCWRLYVTALILATLRSKITLLTKCAVCRLYSGASSQAGRWDTARVTAVGKCLERLTTRGLVLTLEKLGEKYRHGPYEIQELEWKVILPDSVACSDDLIQHPIRVFVH